MKERLAVLDIWIDRLPRTTRLFFQGLQIGSTLIGAAFGTFLEHVIPSGYLIFEVVLPFLTGLAVIAGAAYWLSGKLLEQRP